MLFTHGYAKSIIKVVDKHLRCVWLRTRRAEDDKQSYNIRQAEINMRKAIFSLGANNSFLCEKEGNE